MSRSAILDVTRGNTGWPSDGLSIETYYNASTVDHGERAPETQDGSMEEILKEWGESV